MSIIQKSCLSGDGNQWIIKIMCVIKERKCSCQETSCQPNSSPICLWLQILWNEEEGTTWMSQYFLDEKLVCSARIGSHSLLFFYFKFSIHTSVVVTVKDNCRCKAEVPFHAWCIFNLYFRIKHELSARSRVIQSSPAWQWSRHLLLM